MSAYRERLVRQLFGSLIIPIGVLLTGPSHRETARHIVRCLYLLCHSRNFLRSMYCLAMASIDENKYLWDKVYDWSQAGDEWSGGWGSPRAQWEGCLRPRIFPFLRGRILEIAPGHGRWTQFLRRHCTSLVGIDLAPSCVEICKLRFKDYENLEFKVNDGHTLPMVDDASIDFAFSFDSLVHAESDAVSSYVGELARVLKPDGVAFIHHSNLGAIRRSLWNKVKRRMSGIPFDRHGRAPSMSADKMREFAVRSGM